MNYSTSIMIANDKIRAIRGQYEDAGKQTLFKTLDPSVKVGDYMVVESSTRWGITTVKITALDVPVDYDSPEEVRWAISKIDMATHEEIKKTEAQVIEVIQKGEMRKRREDIKKNTLDAFAAGELDGLDISKMGTPVITNQA